MPIIDVKNLKKIYRNGNHEVLAVKNVTFSVEAGEIYGILGPNGAGKSTTLEILEGLKEPTSGQITVLGHSVPKESESVRRKIGVQLQSASYLHELNLKELLNLFGSFYGIKPDVEKILGFVDLKDKIHDRIENLSGGQQQKFNLAAALVNEPTILFLDEPTTGLDPRSRRNLWDLVRKINQQGITVILTTHYMEEAEFLCNRVAIMDKGEILTIDNPKTLIDRLGSSTLISFFTEDQANLEFLKDMEEVKKIHSVHPKVIVEIMNPDMISKILNRLSEKNIRFSGFTVKTSTLEDVYLDLTGKEFLD